MNVVNTLVKYGVLLLVGGLGIYMVKKTMDSVSYQRLGDQNVLTICKKIS